MKIQEFLLHHGIDRNPFAEEDADSDSVFKRHCIGDTFHPAWAKIFGDPAHPSTSVVFGEKGSGKTALRLQIVDRLKNYNSDNPDKRVFVVEYDDFNPFLERFHERSARWTRKSQWLSSWRLWDHMDAILSLGVSRLVDEIINPGARDPDPSFTIDPEKIRRMPKSHRRDLLLLAAFYDQSTTLPPKVRWHRLRRKLRFGTWLAQWDIALGAATTIGAIAGGINWKGAAALGSFWLWLIVLAGWLPLAWRWLRNALLCWKVQRELRVVNLQTAALRHSLMKLGRSNLDNQPIPGRDRSVDRYELLNKFRTLIRDLGYEGLVVVVDRVDEPHLLGGSADLMRDLIWPMLDNKFLTHPGIGLKLLLPLELSRFIQREEKSFYERSRLDKQNMIGSLEWSGESLYDVASDRLKACRMEGSGDGEFSLRALFDEAVSDNDLVGSLDRLRVPRHLFKFLHKLAVEHCKSFTDDKPRWRFGADTLRATHALYLRDMEAYDRGQGTL